MRLGGPFDQNSKRVLWAVVAGVAVVIALFALMGFSPLDDTSATHIAAGVATLLIGLLVGLGIVYLVTIPFRKSTVEGDRFGPGWVLGLVSALILGQAVFGYVLIAVDAHTIFAIAVGGLGIGASCAVAIRLAAIRESRRSASSE